MLNKYITDTMEDYLQKEDMEISQGLCINTDKCIYKDKDSYTGNVVVEINSPNYPYDGSIKKRKYWKKVIEK
jgi:hypothetical protein